MKTMQKLFMAMILGGFLLIPQLVSSQPPQKMTYQAIVRNSNNQLVTNKQIGMKVSIFQGSPTGTPSYTEI
jgi:hypothetical protein